MLQNILNKIQLFFKTNESSKRSSSNQNIFDETPSKKMRTDLQDNMSGLQDSHSLAYISRNVTNRNDLNRKTNSGFSFNDSGRMPEYNFQQVIINDDFHFQGQISPIPRNISNKPIQRNSVYSKMYNDKISTLSGQKPCKRLTTNECVRLKEKMQYQNLVKRCSVNNYVNIFDIRSSNVPAPNSSPHPSQIIRIDSDDSASLNDNPRKKPSQSGFSNSELPKKPLSFYSKTRNSETPNSVIFPEKPDYMLIKEKPVRDKSDELDGNHFDAMDHNLRRNRLNQTYRSDKSIDSAYAYRNGHKLADSNSTDNNSYMAKIEKRLERNSRVLNNIFGDSKTYLEEEKENKHKPEIKCEGYDRKDDIGFVDTSTPISVDRSDIKKRSKEISDFSEAIEKSPFTNSNYISHLCKRNEYKEAIIKRETEVDFFKKMRQKDESKIINRMNRILQISKRISPAIDESILFSQEEEEEEDDLEICEEANEFPELLPEQEQKVANTFRMSHSEKVAVEGFGLKIKFKDLSTLADLNWLNDEVINFYMNLIVERHGKRVYAFNTFFYPKVASEGQRSVRRWTKNFDIFSFSMILIPVHLGVHWCLAVINLDKKQISYFDSLGGNNQHCLNSLYNYLRDEHKDKKGSEMDMTQWQKIVAKDIPQQMNGSDCGMFTCKFAEYISRNAPISFTQNHMPYFRKRMVLEILEKKLW